MNFLLAPKAARFVLISLELPILQCLIAANSVNIEGNCRKAASTQQTEHSLSLGCKAAFPFPTIAMFHTQKIKL